MKPSEYIHEADTLLDFILKIAIVGISATSLWWTWEIIEQVI